MTQLEKAQALLEIIRDELNVHELVLYNEKHGNDYIRVVYDRGRQIKVIKNGYEVEAPKTAEIMAARFLEEQYEPISKRLESN